MKTHRIDLSPAADDRARMSYGGIDMGTSRQPLLDAARKLLNEGLAMPQDRIETWRGTTFCLGASVGIAANMTVRETGYGPRFAKYESPEQIKQRFAAAAIDR
jgi:hypothetical protein